MYHHFTKILQTCLVQIPSALEGLHEIRGIPVHEMVEILDEDVLDELEVVHPQHRLPQHEPAKHILRPQLEGSLKSMSHENFWIEDIEGKAKCSHLKKFISKGTLRLVFYLSYAHNPPPPLHNFFF
jgi:hypothetical protein